MSAFEADRFNRSRTSPRRTADFVTARSFVRKRRGTQDFACGLPASHSLSLTPANRLNFNRSRTSPRRIICDIQVLRPQSTRSQDFFLQTRGFAFAQPHARKPAQFQPLTHLSAPDS